MPHLLEQGEQTMKKRSLSVICALLCTAYAAQGWALTACEVTATTMPGSRAELTLDKKSFAFLKKAVAPASLEEMFCTGSEIMELPVFGECPDRAGYVALGIPLCTQLFEVPKKYAVKEIVPGWFRLVCTLDFANMVPLGPPSCDYSQCQYVEAPEFPWPGLNIE
jgi:hypothetical protein